MTLHHMQRGQQQLQKPILLEYHYLKYIELWLVKLFSICKILQQIDSGELRGSFHKHFRTVLTGNNYQDVITDIFVHSNFPYYNHYCYSLNILMFHQFLFCSRLFLLFVVTNAILSL